MTVDDPYYGNINHDLLQRIPANARMVLEIGCGTGALGTAYKAINPKCEYVGVEIGTRPVKTAAERLDLEIHADIDSAARELAKKYDKTIDCIIFGSTFERVLEPKKLIKELIPTLKDDGLILSCIPNAQHWSILFSLLRGQFPKENDDLFDKTKLRWFTKEKILTLMNELDLHTIELSPRVAEAEKARLFTEKMSKALQSLNIDQNTFYKEVSPVQYVLRAKKTKCKTMQLTGLMLRPQAGMNDVRMIRPLLMVNTIPGINVEFSSTKVNLLPSDSTIPRIMIWQRNLLRYDDNSLQRIKKVIEAGYVLVGEFDDDPDHWPEISKHSYLNFRGVHAVQTSTSKLAKKLKTFNPEIEVFPNCLKDLPKINKDKWKITDSHFPLKIFFGALNRGESWKMWIGEINEVIKREPNRWEFQVVHDKEFFTALDTDKKIFTQTCGYEEYLQQLKSCHINLLPLINSQFNQYKSDLKFVESAGCEVVAIASPTVYNSTIKNGENGLICDEKTSLRSILHMLSNEPENAKRIAENARIWCSETRMEAYQAQNRLEWYSNLWKKRDYLNNQLIERVPQLKNI